MKLNAFFFAVLLLLFVSCASNDGFVKDRIDACKEGEEVSLRAGIRQQSRADERIPGQIDATVEVANNSDDEIEIDYVRVEPMPMDRDSVYEISGGQVTENRVLAAGEAGTFEIPMTALLRPRTSNEPRLSGSLLDGSIVVGLTDGQVFRCRVQFRY
jgi:hypothetical protein